MQKIKVSRRLLDIPASPIRKLVPLAEQAIKRGLKVYYFNIGDPDIPTPPVMLKVLNNWQKSPITYSRSHGEPSLLQALKKYYRGLGFTFIDEEKLLVTIGGSEAISMAFLAVADEGEEILTFEPFYTNYNSYAAVNQLRIVPVTTSAKDGFHLPPIDKITKKITSKTKAILYCNPNNPTGTVYTKKEIETLVRLAEKYNIFLIADEVYREFVFDGKKHISLLSYMEKIPGQAILVDSLSKRYSLCGVRLGVISSLNKKVMDGVMRVAQGRLSAGLIDQVMSAKLSEVPASFFRQVHREYQSRRDELYHGLQTIPGVFIPKPEGAFYAIVTLPVNDSENFCKFLLTDFNLKGETAMLAPASGFYATRNLGKNQIRIAYILNRDKIKRLVEILRAALKDYKN